MNASAIIRRVTAVLLALGLSAGPDLALATETEASIEAIRNDVVRLGKSVRNYSVEQRDELLQRARETLDRVDAQIDDLQRELDAKASQLGAETLKRRRAAMRSLRESRNQVAEWYGGVRYGAADAWSEVRAGFADAWDAMRRSLDSDDTD